MDAAMPVIGMFFLVLFGAAIATVFSINRKIDVLSDSVREMDAKINRLEETLSEGRSHERQQDV